jgi:hypothetical protein
MVRDFTPGAQYSRQVQIKLGLTHEYRCRRNAVRVTVRVKGEGDG